MRATLFILRYSVTVSTVRFHRANPGSTPGIGEILFSMLVFFRLSKLDTMMLLHGDTTLTICLFVPTALLAKIIESHQDIYMTGLLLLGGSLTIWDGEENHLVAFSEV